MFVLKFLKGVLRYIGLQTPHLSLASLPYLGLALLASMRSTIQEKTSSKSARMSQKKTLKDLGGISKKD